VPSVELDFSVKYTTSESLHLAKKVITNGLDRDTTCVLSDDIQDALIDASALSMDVSASDIEFLDCTEADDGTIEAHMLCTVSTAADIFINTTVDEIPTVLGSSLTTAVETSSFSTSLQYYLTLFNVTGASLATVIAANITAAATIAPPTFAPTVAPIEWFDMTCFAGSETVMLQSGQSLLLSEVHVGDRVLAADSYGRPVFSDVIAVPHARNNIRARFVQLATSTRDIKLTPDHLILHGVCGGKFSLGRSEDVLVGSCVRTVEGEDQVLSSRMIEGYGLYTLVTSDTFVVVNGFVASPFGDNHAVGNAFYNIHRLAFRLVPEIARSFWLKQATEFFGGVVGDFTFL